MESSGSDGHMSRPHISSDCSMDSTFCSASALAFNPRTMKNLTVESEDDLDLFLDIEELEGPDVFEVKRSVNFPMSPRHEEMVKPSMTRMKPASSYENFNVFIQKVKASKFNHPDPMSPNSGSSGSMSDMSTCASSSSVFSMGDELGGWTSGCAGIDEDAMSLFSGGMSPRSPRFECGLEVEVDEDDEIDARRMLVNTTSLKENARKADFRGHGGEFCSKWLKCLEEMEFPEEIEKEPIRRTLEDADDGVGLEPAHCDHPQMRNIMFRRDGEYAFRD